MDGHEANKGFFAVIEGSRKTLVKGFAPKTIYRWAPFLPGTMSVLDLFRNEYVNSKVVNKYRLENGNVGLIVEDAATHRRYHVEFRDNYKGPSSENLFGLLKEPFAGKDRVSRQAGQGRRQHRLNPELFQRPVQGGILCAFSFEAGTWARPIEALQR